MLTFLKQTITTSISLKFVLLSMKGLRVMSKRNNLASSVFTQQRIHYKHKSSYLYKMMHYLLLMIRIEYGLYLTILEL
ncbi:hypothetical protein FGO68_gene16160 [Halteria grandinella]|uniref:Uncharacterized protein n=1 Tax=Halteria grandinella TaxID=5974 RepID=A0A8J8NXN8_HALGN|nr:hypothetical protein FGO68_gene16160 [Halteria grandinella]